MSNGRKLSSKAEKGSAAAGLINFFSPLVEGITGKPAKTYISSPTKGGRGGGRAAQDSKERAAVEEFDAAQARKRAASRQSGAGKKDVKPNFPKPSTESLPPGLEGVVNKENRIETIGTGLSETFNINSFRSEIINNDVLPSHSYLVTFSPFRADYVENKVLSDFVITKRNTLMMRCESMILPTPSLLEEENIRRYGYGPVEKMPYGVQFSDVSMTWLVDKNSEIIDFMHHWMNTIVMHDSPGASMAQSPDKRAGLEG